MTASDIPPSIPQQPPPVASVQRPWGSFRQYAHNVPCTVSLMMVLPGQRLSLQSHVGRAELWIVIDDGAVIQTDDQTRTYNAGDEVWIPAECRHRLSCQGDNPVRVLEVAFGDWQQDDITRYDDDYNRPEHEHGK